MFTPADDLTGAVWFKSSHSDNQGGACVECAHVPTGTFAVRDSKSPAGPALTLAPAAWTRFTTALASGEF